MPQPTTNDPQARWRWTPSRPHWLHWCWLVTSFLVGIGYLFLIPPFQTNDEPAHVAKLYTIAHGDLACATLPARAIDILRSYSYRPPAEHYSFKAIDSELACTNDARIPVPLTYNGACHYPASAYLFPALLVDLTEALWPAARGRTLAATYAARLGNWLTLTAAVLLMLLLMPQLRSWTLFMYSLPMVIHQSIAINQDAFIMAVHCLLVIAFFRLRGWRALLPILFIVLTLVHMKPVYAPMILWAAPATLELTLRGDARARRLKLGLLVGACVVVTAGVVWKMIPFATQPHSFKTDGPSWSDSGAQVWSLFHDPMLPLAALKQQLHDNLGHGHMNGGYVSILGVFGWAEYELTWPTYRTILLAAALAGAADVVQPGATLLPPMRGFVDVTFRRVLPVLAPIVVTQLVNLGMWVVFSPVGKPLIIGVQGRYYHGSLFLLGVGLISWLSRRRLVQLLGRRDLWHLGLTAASFACILDVAGDCLAYLRVTYWGG